MKEVFVCFAGEWVLLTQDSMVFGVPYLQWFSDNFLYDHQFIEVQHGGRLWKISPVFVQLCITNS